MVLSRHELHAGDWISCPLTRSTSGVIRGGLFGHATIDGVGARNRACLVVVPLLSNSLTWETFKNSGWCLIAGVMDWCFNSR